MRYGTPVGLSLAALLWAPVALAETHALAPAGGGLAALDVRVDLARAVVVANGVELPIALDRALLPTEDEVVVEAVAIGQGKHVAHVRVPAHPSGPAWEAILAAGRREPIFAGMTGFAAGDPGERTGMAVQVGPTGAASFVLVGNVREDLSLCGQSTTLLDPLALDASSLALKPDGSHRLSPEQQTNAVKLTAIDKASALDAPLARLLVARGSSVPDSRGSELTDGDLQTTWSEKRPGVGQGDFVVMAAPKEVPIARVQIAVAPQSPPGNGAAPKTFFLVTTTQTFEVTMPGDAWLKPGEAYEIMFPKPIETSCLALVLGSAYTRALAHPEVSVAELVAFSEFDATGATLDDLAKRLSSERSVAAAQVLERAGPGALAAVAKAYDTLDARGRALAIDVAASHQSCEEASSLLARGLCDTGGQAPRKARAKLERCKGAAPALAQRLREDAASRSCVAPLLATIAPELALDPIADAIAAVADAGDRETRSALRGAFAQALKTAPPGRLAAMLGDARRSTPARFEMMRAAQARVTEARAESEGVVAELLRGAAPMRTRYLVLGPLGELARSGDRDAATHVANALAHDSEWAVRVRAAELASGLPEATAALAAAARDPEPRVREAALGALAAAPSAEGIRGAAEALAHDGWSFVKIKAIGVLVSAPAARTVDDALGEVLHDPSTRVRGAALVALARRRATSWRHAMRERLDDPGEDAEVRGAAARALGAVCDVESVDRLTELARAIVGPGADEDAIQVGLGALVGLAAMQPRDLRGRVEPLLAASAPPYARVAAQQALAARPMCR